MFVLNFKRTLWYCGEMWQYVRMGSLGTHLCQDCKSWVMLRKSLLAFQVFAYIMEFAVD
jgi:hypothetical protein